MKTKLCNDMIPKYIYENKQFILQLSFNPTFFLIISLYKELCEEQYFLPIFLNVLFQCVSIKRKPPKILQGLIDTFSITWYIQNLPLNPTLLKGDLQSQKKSHIEKEEAKDCWVVIYPSKRTSGGRGGILWYHYILMTNIFERKSIHSCFIIWWRVILMLKAAFLRERKFHVLLMG